MMWYKYAVLCFYGLCAGGVTAAGYYAVITSIGVINRFAQHTHTADKVRGYESVLIISAIVGTALTLYDIPPMFYPWMTVIFGLFAGAFIGCFIVSLAEAIKGIPILIRRTRIKKGLQLLIYALAIGKCLGSICYFLFYGI